MNINTFLAVHTLCTALVTRCREHRLLLSSQSRCHMIERDKRRERPQRINQQKKPVCRNMDSAIREKQAGPIIMCLPESAQLLGVSRPPVDAVVRLKSCHLSQKPGEDCGQDGRGLEKGEVACLPEQTCLLLCCCLLGSSLLCGGGRLLGLDGLCDLLRRR